MEDFDEAEGSEAASTGHQAERRVVQQHLIIISINNQNEKKKDDGLSFVITIEKRASRAKEKRADRGCRARNDTRGGERVLDDPNIVRPYF